MTENQIIQYLRDNKLNGVAFCFMPKEVQAWCKNNYHSKLFFYYNLDYWCLIDVSKYVFDFNLIITINEDSEFLEKYYI